ncbi:uncharacterized protein LOC118233972 isoform X3 [Anguilla anguilla]|uniref:uncharacterized protein LOC118233972 isoform X3 n=2 Tax=Anguilla anguilla TaxID=7936 RepID=UPI0015A7A4A2|nr:uncharacterized protein LOC118233972 isoform X3 [Anguilla anguilla]
MDPPRADHPHDPSKADRTTFKAAEGGDLSVEGGGACRPPERGGVNRGREGIGAEPVWFEHSAYERAESSYQRWLADQEGARAPASGSSRGHGDGGACHRQVQATWVSAGASLPDFDPGERCPLVELWARPIPAAPRPAAAAASHVGRTGGPALPASSPAPKRRSRSGQPRLAPERRKEAWAEKPPHDLAEPAGHAHAHGQGHAHSHGHAQNQGHAHSHGHAHGHHHWRRGGAQRGRGHRWNRKRWCSEGDGGSPWQQYGAPPSTMSGVQYLAQERIWFDKSRYDEAERRFYEGVNGPSHASQGAGGNLILQDIARARENIQKSLAGTTMYAAGDQDELVTRMRGLELENQSLQNVVQDLRSALFNLESRVALLERTPAAASPFQTNSVQQPKVRAPVEEEEEEDDDLDLFGSDEEDEEAERIREERLKAYAEKKAKKPALIAKSSILLDVKPWDDETDMVKLEECVRSVQADGLLWGSSKLVPVGYGIKKLQIQCVVEDDKVGTDMLEEEITKFEDYVQSVDVAAFNKI